MRLEKSEKKNNPRKSYIQIFKFSKIETSDIMQKYSERAARDFQQGIDEDFYGCHHPSEGCMKFLFEFECYPTVFE